MPKSPESPLDKIKPASRRTVLKAGATLLLSLCAAEAARAASIVAVRVWPAADYTRVTLENDSKLKASHFIVKDPHRLVVEIEGVELDTKLKSLVAKIQPNDPTSLKSEWARTVPASCAWYSTSRKKFSPRYLRWSPWVNTSID